MSDRSGFTDDRSAPALRRWIKMDRSLDCVDRIERLEFLDHFSIAVVKMFGGFPDSRSWERAVGLPDELLGTLLDQLAPVLEALWDMDGVVFIDSSGQEILWPNTRVDPFAQPEWWPFPLTPQDRQWIARHRRVRDALHLLDEEEHAEVHLALFEELRRAHMWSPDVRWLLETGEWFRETVHVVVPILEAELVERGYLIDIWKESTWL